jgi:hypothetical protein
MSFVLSISRQSLEPPGDFFNLCSHLFNLIFGHFLNSISSINLINRIYVFFRHYFSFIFLFTHLFFPLFSPLVRCSRKYISIKKLVKYLHQYCCVLLCFWQYSMNFVFCLIVKVNTSLTSSGRILASFGSILRAYLYASLVVSSQYGFSALYNSINLAFFNFCNSSWVNAILHYLRINTKKVAIATARIPPIVVMNKSIINQGDIIVDHKNQVKDRIASIMLNVNTKMANQAQIAWSRMTFAYVLEGNN